MSDGRVEHVLRYETGETVEGTDELAVEEPLEIRVRGRAVSVTMRTPPGSPGSPGSAGTGRGPVHEKSSGEDSGGISAAGEDGELAVGFLLTEGVIRSRDDVLNIEHCERNEHGNRINVQLGPYVPVDFDKLTRHVFASSSCGLCGKATIEAVRSTWPPPLPEAPPEAAPPESPPGLAQVVRIADLLAMPAAMRRVQHTFGRTGGLHAAAIFDFAGNLIVAREDIGRHNAVDKVLGYGLLRDLLPFDKHVLLVSGRTSFEILQKSLAGGIPVVAGISAPSSLAVAFARDSGQTLVGFLRQDRLNIYSHPARIRASTPHALSD